MKTLHLDIEYDYSFDLYGVVASCKEYKLAWALNNLLNLQLVKQKDLCYELLEKNRLVISNYQYSTEHSIVRLFKNKALGFNTLKKPFLLPEIKEYDYILQVSGTAQDLCAQDLLAKLKCVSLVQYVKQFNPLTLKFRENLLF